VRPDASSNTAAIGRTRCICICDDADQGPVLIFILFNYLSRGRKFLRLIHKNADARRVGR
jgi:hypothetical protein